MSTNLIFVSHLSVRKKLKQTGGDMEEIAAVNLCQPEKLTQTVSNNFQTHKPRQNLRMHDQRVVAYKTKATSTSTT